MDTSIWRLAVVDTGNGQYTVTLTHSHLNYYRKPVPDAVTGAIALDCDELHSLLHSFVDSMELDLAPYPQGRRQALPELF